ncbi:hypothetical protein F5051DRAFT_444576 [Lentinula edodes]|nr:hypothetical protein F5051DRAFT_444576 [Lentinula edodes]
MVEEQIDRLPMNKDHAQADAFETVKTDLQLIDGWRQQYPNWKAYTFMQKRAGGIQNHARLDRIYIKPTMEDSAFEWRIQLPGLHTDHSIVSLRITCETAPDIGKGRWCWPKHIMYDKYLTLYIKKEGLILQAKLDELEDQPNRAYETQILWSGLQDRIAKEARKRAKIIIPRIDKQIKDTETNLRLIEDDQTLTDDERSLLVTLLSKKLAELENKRHQSKRQNVKARNIVHGETISRYWSAMNKSKSPRETIQRLRIHEMRTVNGHTNQPNPVNEENQPTGNQDNNDALEPNQPIYEQNFKRMADMMSAYHGKIQIDETPTDNNQRHTVTEAVLNRIKTRISDQHRQKMTDLLTDDDVDEALKLSANYKAPGLNGIPYKVWKIIHARCQAHASGLHSAAWYSEDPLLL